MNLNLRTIGLALALIILAISSTLGQTTPAENPNHQELRQMRDELLTAMNKGDMEGTLKYLTTNVVITWQNAEVSRGHDGVRAYYNRVMTGPNRILDGFNCNISPDELTILYGDNMGICYGSSDEHYKLANGKDLNVKGRWTSTLVKENGHWLVASLHCSTDLFDNVILNLARKATWAAAVFGFVIGILIGFFLGWRRRRAFK
jgi:hypothetical protein